MTAANLSPGINTRGKCPECGARLIQGKNCQAIFEEFLALEYTDQAYGQVHFLTVACFMIQHSRYSDKALVWMEEQLRKVLDGEFTSHEIVQQMGRKLNQVQRRWKINRKTDDPPLVKIPWSMTIADVAILYHDAQSYCVLVDQWARRTLDEMHPQLMDLDQG